MAVRGERGARARECESEAIDVGGCGKIRALVVKICRFIGKRVLIWEKIATLRNAQDGRKNNNK